MTAGQCHKMLQFCKFRLLPWHECWYMSRPYKVAGDRLDLVLMTGFQGMVGFDISYDFIHRAGMVENHPCYNHVLYIVVWRFIELYIYSKGGGGGCLKRATVLEILCCSCHHTLFMHDLIKISTDIILTWVGYIGIAYSGGIWWKYDFPWFQTKSTLTLSLGHNLSRCSWFLHLAFPLSNLFWSIRGWSMYKWFPSYWVENTCTGTLYMQLCFSVCTCMWCNKHVHTSGIMVIICALWM